jgi:hypothetical protein
MVTNINNLDRQIQLFQFKIQQKIALKDDELERTAKELTLYKTQIAESKIRFQQLERDVQAAKYQVNGGKQCDEASLRARIARRKTNHNLTIQKIEADHSSAVDSLQEQFTQEMEHIRQSHDTQLKEQIESLERDKTEIESEIIRYYESANELRKVQNPLTEEEEDIVEENNFDCSTPMILQLQETIQIRNAERIESLVNSKRKLTECLQVLEQLDHDQENRTVEMRKTLERLDSRYHEQLNRLKQSEKDYRSEQRERFATAQKNLRKLQHALHKIQSGQREQLKSFAIVQKGFAKSAPIFVNENVDPVELKKVEKRKANIKKSKQLRDVKEAKLVESRSVNDVLRRQVAEIKHELKYVQRYRRICAIGDPHLARMM